MFATCASGLGGDYKLHGGKEERERAQQDSQQLATLPMVDEDYRGVRQAQGECE